MTTLTSPATVADARTIAFGDDRVFAALLDAAERCSLGQITHALYGVGGEYRRNV